MSHPIPPERFSTLVPSSKAAPPSRAGPERRYTITVRRKDRSGRWNQIATWIVTTDEEDMQGPLTMGLKENYQIIIKEGKPPPQETPNGQP